jgi:hypothetical protein
VKFDIYVAGARLDAWTDAEIQMDEQYSANAQFGVHSNGTGPWLTNLSKVKITGRECRPETAMWGFEDPLEIGGWHLTSGLVSNGIDYTQSAYGTGSWTMTWSAPAQLVEIAQQSAGLNLYGMVFWGWIHTAFLTTFTPQLILQAFATDGTQEWSSPLLFLAGAAAAGWQAIGLRPIPIAAAPGFPTNVTRWGFRLQFRDAIPAAQAGKALVAVNLDSIQLCGKPYATALALPPFPPSNPRGALEPWVPLECAHWDEFEWADELHITAADAGWCTQGITWGNFNWAAATNPKPDDPQWG